MAWDPEYRGAQNWGQVVKVLAFALVMVILFGLGFTFVRRDQEARQAERQAEQQAWMDAAR